MGNKYTKGSEWRKWDLQVQTILDDNYIELKEYFEELKESYPHEWKAFINSVGSEEYALKFDSKTYFFNDQTVNEKVRAKNYAKTFIAFLEAFQKEEVCVAVTDHNYDHNHLLDALLDASDNSSLVNIVGGVEINVQGVHMLALFGRPVYEKSSFSEGITTFLSKIDVDSKKHNNALTVSNKSYTEVLDIIQEQNGITIYPHCNSDNGLFQERSKTDRTYLSNQFNYQEFNILQGKNKVGGKKLLEYINGNPDLTSEYCYMIASDARCLRDILSPDDAGNYTWIKADPTFEGLKQIIFEPTTRISIQGSLPEDKTGYQVIDRIEIQSSKIFNKEIHLNENMNSIIGGRSTGKSLLLTAIAQKLKTEERISFSNKPEYEKLVKEISNSISVVWKDGEEKNGREIEFFQQGYMYELATDERKLDQLIQDILRIKGKNSFFETYSTKKAGLKKSISSNINHLFQVRTDISRRSLILREKGDRKGVEDEIQRLEKKLKELDSLSLTDFQRENYERHKKIIEDSSQLVEQFRKDISQITRLKEISLIRQNVEYEFSALSDESRKSIKIIYENLKSDVQDKWQSYLDESIRQLSERLANEEKKISEAKDDAGYRKANQAYENSLQLKQIQDRIEKQKTALNEIKSITGEVSELEEQRNQLIEKIITDHGKYFSVTEELLRGLSDGQDDLKINAEWKFNRERYRSILESELNLKDSSNRKLADFEHNDHDHYMSQLGQLLQKLISDSLTFKGGHTSESLARALLPECFYNISYNPVYEDDSFNEMSEGKKAFVVLKLLLDFSDKKCPILIDQPEDNLDNRAIYDDLVKYLKKKKIKRQIIVVTHNPNIVVNSDSELVIVANQHGVKSKNPASKKFAYKSGSLENSKAFDSSSYNILDTQGIREHVCAILEGGTAAFKLREKKYAIKS